MTPFGQKLRELRAARGTTLKQMAAALHVTPAYLSALENGRRGKPRKGLVMQVCAVLGIIWDDAEDLVRLARLSDPRPKIDTAGLSPKATELANRLAGEIARLTEPELNAMLATLQRGEPTGGARKKTK